jgi:hypothetical protein
VTNGTNILATAVASSTVTWTPNTLATDLVGNALTVAAPFANATSTGQQF